MRILVTGAAGQVGARVVEALDGHHDVLGAARDTLDLADREQVEQVVAEFAPDAVVNAAAMTNVDACERDPERAFAVNALGVRTLAQATARRGAHLVHVSTDYVFDGEATPPLRRVGRGASDLGVRPLEARRRAGGRAARRDRGRPSAPPWVFGRRGTDLLSWAFGAYDRGELDGVLADQVSIPTYAPDLAVLLARFAVERRQGLFHATSGSEAVTRHELIVTALEARGLRPVGDRADRRRRSRSPRGPPEDERARQPCAAPRRAPVAPTLARRGHRVRQGLAHERGRGRRRRIRRPHHRRVPAPTSGTRSPAPTSIEERVRALSKGEVPILEEGLPALVAEGLGAGRLRFVVGATNAARDAEFVFLCVQTPQSETRRGRPLARWRRWSRRSRRCCAPGTVVINKSTMPVGSTQFVARAPQPRPAPPTTSASRRTPSSCARAPRCATSSSRAGS